MPRKAPRAARLCSNRCGAMLPEGRAHNYCRTCAADKKRIWNRKRAAITRGHDLRRCVICGEMETSMRGGLRKTLSRDHNHTTGQQRGALCFRCNTALGLMRDNPDLLLAAADYLMSWAAGED